MRRRAADLTEQQLTETQRRFAATLAIVDAYLAQPIVGWQQWLGDRVRAHSTDIATLTAVLDEEVRLLEQQGWALSAALAEEHRSAADWEQKAMSAVQSGHVDLARQALIGATDHREQADLLSAELREYEALLENYRRVLVEIRDGSAGP